jgi:uncharacterized FAD-dependent dehydrogenase
LSSLFFIFSLNFFLFFRFFSFRNMFRELLTKFPPAYTVLDMVQNLGITLFPGEEQDSALIRRRVAGGVPCKSDEIRHIEITKKSTDARRRQVKIHLQVTAYINENPPAAGSASPARWKPAKTPQSGGKSVVIVGTGPAGLFAALRLLEAGIRPVIIERGKETPARKQDIAAIGQTGRVDPNSNYCFGEGGAGAFSDGKLFSRSNKRGNIRKVLEILRYFGAEEAILTDARPHIGSDKLPFIINAITAKIRSLGGDIRYETLCRDFAVSPGTGQETQPKKLRGIVTERLGSGEITEIPCEAVILAAGHSAPDLYRLLGKIAPEALEAKTFAMGVRVEHPRQVIDAIQYHGEEKNRSLPAAEYRLIAQVGGRGVYSFCMCPGGVIVPSASAPGEIVVNGMSPSGRNTRWSNAALVVEIRPEDSFGYRADSAGGLAKAVGAAGSAPALRGLDFRESLERTAFEQGNPWGITPDNPPGTGSRAPAQGLMDFLAGRESPYLAASSPGSSYAPGLTPSRLDLWLPEPIAGGLKKAIPEFERKMRGFVCPEAILVAPETRTSTPVRILRNPETFESPAISGLFPAGEGSGYAGGIVSSAMDGEKAAAALANLLLC